MEEVPVRAPYSPPSDDEKIRVNERIRVPQVRVVDSDGQQLGILDTKLALEKAREQDLDLIEIAPNAVPPVCKILDFGKYKFQLAKKERDSRKKQSHTEVKKIRFTPVTDDHDFDTKVKQSRGLILEGNKVKAVVLFRGRLLTRKEFGDELLQRFCTALADVAKVEISIQMEGARSMSVQLMKK